MKVTNADIWTATTGLDQGGIEPAPLAELLAERWPVKTAYWLTRLARTLSGFRADINEVRIGLLRQYGTPDEKGSIRMSQGCDNWDEFITAYNELMAQEVEIEGIAKIVLPETDSCSVKPTALLALEAFIDMA